MKIAFFVNFCHTSGTYYRWHNLAIALKEYGHEVDIYASDHDWKSKKRVEIRDNINYYITPSLVTSKLFYNPNDPFTALRRLLSIPKKQYEVYHVFQPFLHAFVPWFYLKMKYKDSLFLYDWDDLWTNGLFENSKSFRETYLFKVTKIIESNIYKYSDIVTTCSEFLADKLPSSKKRHLLYNGYWEKPRLDKYNIRKKWRLEEGTFYMAYIGKTANEIEWLSKALTYINDKSNDVKLIVCGPPEDYVYKHFSRNDKSFIYLGELTTNEANEIAASSDLGLIPLEDTQFNQSRFPIKFFDFLSVGTPVYMTNVGEIARIATEQIGVYKVDANQITWIENLPIIIKKVKLNKNTFNVNSLTKMFSWNYITEGLLKIYKQGI